ncbi:MAG: exo-alpha-sialidase [Akkermansiaceae bacterium]|nr:exo-alpha-sialidase [Akkermansiaceae bacterium]MCP5551550.1 exo-alpha-sialidase [Akkermansiaceae bacterium]
MAAESPEAIAAAEKRREEIPLGGDFIPNPQVPAFVVVGHGGRIIVSKDDGKTWTQTFFGYPAADHGVWSTRTCTYGDGLFVVAFGWGAPTSWLASDDGVNWRHLTSGATVLPEAKGNPRIMPGTWGLAAGKRTIVGTGYMSMAATSDFGKTFLGFGMWGAFKDDPRGRFQTHHLDPVYCGDASGRFLALGDNRGESGPKFGHLFASDDLGKTWKWLAPKGLDAASGRGAMVCNGSLLLMTDQGAENAWISADAGETWSGPFPTGTKRAVLSVVGDEFWLSGKPSRASADGKTWRELPAAVPQGQIIASDKGTLVSIHQQRTNILRSTDGGETWDEVYSYEPEKLEGGAQGLRDGAFGLVAP